jgi:dTDP-4-amino-4,6-dideoxygalactose transaminase
MTNKPIFVSRPFLPDLNEFVDHLEEIWENRILTNSGPKHHQFEALLCEYLGVEHITLFSNATLALIVALKALQVSGEVITTPYSFVATAHSILWSGCTPVFVDIDPESLNIDPEKIESAITDKTSAILPVHCYGNPCDFQKINSIAEQHNLKVIYDSAHAFGVCKASKSILRYGDLSVLSFHATKVFNTFEGGAIVCSSKELKEKINQIKNFGFTSETSVDCVGINAKMSEFNAALGVLQLKYVDSAINRREEIDRYYRKAFDGLCGIKCLPLLVDKPNYSYFPIFVESGYGMSRDGLYDLLKSKNIFARRYFYPLITDFPMYKMNSKNQSRLPVAESIATRILCLPIYPDLSISDQDRIISIIKSK